MSWMRRRGDFSVLQPRKNNFNRARRNFSAEGKCHKMSAPLRSEINAIFVTIMLLVSKVIVSVHCNVGIKSNCYTIKALLKDLSEHLSLC